MKATSKQIQLFLLVGFIVLSGLSAVGLLPVIPEVDEESNTQGISQAQGESVDAEVVRVVDGDTIKVNITTQTGGVVEETVRLIGLDTPELARAGRPADCFAAEAKQKLGELSQGKMVKLAPDATQADVDRYGRILRYVFIGEVNLSQEMIAQGYGFEYTYDKPYLYQEQFKQAQLAARRNSLGLWAASVCNG